MIRKVDEWMRNHLGLRIGADNRKSLIGAAAVDDYNPLGPSELVERASDIGGLVVGQNERRNLIEHRR